MWDSWSDILLLSFFFWLNSLKAEELSIIRQRWRQHFPSSSLASFKLNTTHVVVSNIVIVTRIFINYFRNLLCWLDSTGIRWGMHTTPNSKLVMLLLYSIEIKITRDLLTWHQHKMRSNTISSEFWPNFLHLIRKQKISRNFSWIMNESCATTFRH